MAIIKFETFKKFIDELEVFDIETLKYLYTKYEKIIIDDYFKRYYHSLTVDSDIENFFNKYSVFFEQMEKDDEALTEKVRSIADEERADKVVDDVVYSIFNEISQHPLMNEVEEEKYGYDLKNGKEKLTILKDNSYVLDKKFDDEEEKYCKVISLYPDLNLEKVFLSIKDLDDVDLLRTLTKLRFKLCDESILSHDIDNIVKYLNLCENGVPDIEVLSREFNDLDFSNVETLNKNELSYQINLFHDYIVAKYNYCKRNFKLVVSVAKNYSRKLAMEDAFQVGCVGLTKAIDKYDVSKGNKFSTYATWWIRQSIAREIADTSYSIRKPVHMGELINKYKRYVHDYLKLNGVEPSLYEASNYLGISIEEVENLMIYSRDVVSLDAPVGDGEDYNETLGSFIADTDTNIEDDIVDRDKFDRVNDVMVNCLTDRELFVLYNRYGLNDEQRELTLEEIGQILGITRERVRQIEAKALRKTRHRTRGMR